VKIAEDPNSLRLIGQKSISYRLAIPYEYLKGCPSEVQAYNLKFWIRHEQNDQLFFRFDGEEARAILIPRYGPVKNKSMAD
jgi:hypothetical protein